MTVLMVIGSSNVGGAEKQFVRLAEELRSQTSIAILVIGKSGPYRKIYRELGLRYIESSGSLFSDLLTTLVAIWRFRPNTLLLWLYRATVIGSITGKIFRVPNIVITARNTDWPHNTFPKRLLLRLSSMLASSIVANSNRAADFHKSIGFPGKKIRVIRNFITTPAEVKTRSVREISVFGIAARAVEGKGHFLAIDALNEVSKFFPNIKLSIIGFGIGDWTALRKKLQSANFEFELLEGTLDLSTWFSGIDVCLALSDSWDSDSNTVLEAICHRVPVICSEKQSTEELLDSISLISPLVVESLIGVILNFLRRDPILVAKDSLRLSLKLEKVRRTEQLMSSWFTELRNSA